MRKLYFRQLVVARHEMLSIFEAIDLGVHDAVRAFIEGDRKLASKVSKRSQAIEARCANLEAVCYNLIATQGPVASDFRLLQTIIYTNFCLQRMNDKLARIARAAKLKISMGIELPADLVTLVEQEAAAALEVMGAAASVLVIDDLGLLKRLNELEESAHGIYEEFFRVFNRASSIDLDDDKSYDNYRRVIMVSRYLDRCAQYSIDAASRVTFLLTGQRLGQVDLVGMDEDELEGMRVPAGEGALLRPEVDCRFVAAIPVDEVSPELVRLIEAAAEADEGEEDDD